MSDLARRGILGGLALGGAMLAARQASATGVPQKLLYDAVINVLNFGAIGDGVTDDTTAINNAISAAAANGRLAVFIPPGTFGVSAQIAVPNNVSIIGVGSSNDLPAGIAISTIKVLSAAFPKSTPVFKFATGWVGRFENVLIDCNTFATCGMSHADIRNSIVRNIGIRGIGFNLTSDYNWLITATAVSAALNLFEHVVFDQYNAAVGINGLVCIGTETGGVEAAAVTDNTFINCSFGVSGSGTPGAGYGFSCNLAKACDNNWFFGTNFGMLGSGDVLCLNNQGTYDALVGENYFFGCVFSAASGNNIVADYNYTPNTFFGCFFQSQTFSLGTHAWVDCRCCTYGDAPQLGAQGVSVGASPFTYTNTFPSHATLYFYGGTYSAVTITRRTGAASTGSTPTASFGIGLSSTNIYSIPLEPTDQVTITYTVAPTMTVAPQR